MAEVWQENGTFVGKCSSGSVGQVVYGKQSYLCHVEVRVAVARQPHLHGQEEVMGLE